MQLVEDMKKSGLEAGGNSDYDFLVYVTV